MEVRFMTSASIVTTHPAEDRQLFIGALGSPLTSDDGYLFREKLNGDKHFGIWRLP